jgi:hypothetical protein
MPQTPAGGRRRRSSIEESIRRQTQHLAATPIQKVQAARRERKTRAKAQLNKNKKEEKRADEMAAAGIPEPQEKTVSFHPGTKSPNKTARGKGGNRRSKKKKSQVLTTGQGKKPTRTNQEEKEKERDGGDPVRAARRRKEAAGGHQEQALRHKIRQAKQQRTKKVEGKRVRAHKSTLPAGSNQNEMLRVAAFNMDQGVSGAQAEMVLAACLPLPGVGNRAREGHGLLSVVLFRQLLLLPCSLPTAHESHALRRYSKNIL